MIQSFIESDRRCIKKHTPKHECAHTLSHTDSTKSFAREMATHQGYIHEIGSKMMHRSGNAVRTLSHTHAHLHVHTHRHPLTRGGHRSNWTKDGSLGKCCVCMSKTPVLPACKYKHFLSLTHTHTHTRIRRNTHTHTHTHTRTQSRQYQTRYACGEKRSGGQRK